ncbi:rRNA small subunit methyltransferase G [Syntrophomonas zehnderi OL-4]|uniref:Ribosomal RNA small subunit methyltransferase G n=1 Tax=Syntrophomonas zehnderi OL-4 TaxID=690567 RepID=A0A0E3W2W0_9FIRM|nr:16S rRNA (guanine(527)-N(7))-methyltransferase RsmG [Syntrophomonas zehnderi]CFX25442.1 rRNA small subunit methyltransferase G [Syntrophomonas zehnderi OL-4]
MEINVNRYLELLIKENEKQNLVSRKAGREELIGHVEDSLKLLDFYKIKDKKVIDIGSGAGFPALLLAIYCPDAMFTLVESDLKKSNFLIQAVGELGLKNVRVLRERAEILGQNPLYRAHYDICTSRAVAALNVLLEYGLPLLELEGRLFLWKGKNYAAEIAQAEQALTVFKARVEDVCLYSLLEEKDRAIVVVKKEAPTPQKYPRRVGIPAKRPI